MKNHKKENKQSNHLLPFVSVCTPTFNRRPFIPSIIKCFNNQKYPKDRMEWIIIDDGTDPIEDLIASHSNVKYFKYNDKMTLGRKRNLMHENPERAPTIHASIWDPQKDLVKDDPDMKRAYAKLPPTK